MIEVSKRIGPKDKCHICGGDAQLWLKFFPETNPTLVSRANPIKEPISVALCYDHARNTSFRIESSLPLSLALDTKKKDGKEGRTEIFQVQNLKDKKKKCAVLNCKTIPTITFRIANIRQYYCLEHAGVQADKLTAFVKGKEDVLDTAKAGR